MIKETFAMKVIKGMSDNKYTVLGMGQSFSPGVSADGYGDCKTYYLNEDNETYTVKDINGKVIDNKFKFEDM